jgi:hypothetical protein
MAGDQASGGLSQLEDHYKTFIVRLPVNHHTCAGADGKVQTEQDFAQIAAAGLNYVRIPIPYWAIEVWPGEPFLPQTCWKCVSTGSTSVFGSHSSPDIFSWPLDGHVNMAFALI